MKQYIGLFLKGMGMGAANVVPGVSGGTIALITGIFEKLIDSIKSFDILAIRYFFSGKFRQFAQHVNLYFLLALFAGIFASIISIARIFGYLLEHHQIHLMSFFFGLILASIYFVGKTIDKWNIPVIISFIAGTAIAVSLTVLEPAQENASLWYLFICGIVATCSMILPGLSGSFVLIMMGNYQLVMIDAVNNLDMKTLIPVIIGAVTGLLMFSNLLSWLYKKFRNPTIAILTGFILGSLGIIWPWKTVITVKNELGQIMYKDGEAIIKGYNWFLPEHFNTEVILALFFIITGIIVIWGTEILATRKSTKH
jgi:putative membrane protein